MSNVRNAWKDRKTQSTRNILSDAAQHCCDPSFGRWFRDLKQRFRLQTQGTVKIAYFFDASLVGRLSDAPSRRWIWWWHFKFYHWKYSWRCSPASTSQSFHQLCTTTEEVADASNNITQIKLSRLTLAWAGADEFSIIYLMCLEVSRPRSYLTKLSWTRGQFATLARLPTAITSMRMIYGCYVM